MCIDAGDDTIYYVPVGVYVELTKVEFLPQIVAWELIAVIDAAIPCCAWEDNFS